MKFRRDFVTNSSSSSYLVCFARIADKEKADKIIKDEELSRGIDFEVLTSSEVIDNLEHRSYRWFGSWLDAEWAGVFDMDPSKEYIEAHMDDDYIVVRDEFDIEEPWDGEPDYDVDYDDFDAAPFIDCIVEENGFAEIEIGYGAGRDG